MNERSALHFAVELKEEADVDTGIAIAKALIGAGALPSELDSEDIDPLVTRQPAIAHCTVNQPAAEPTTPPPTNPRYNEVPIAPALTAP
jgi:hypothetical protein